MSSTTKRPLENRDPHADYNPNMDGDSESPPKKSKTTKERTNVEQLKQQEPKWEWTPTRNQVLKNAISNCLNSYSNISKEYFPTVKPKDIQNHIAHTKELSDHLEQVKKKASEETKAKFDSGLTRSVDPNAQPQQQKQLIPYSPTVSDLSPADSNWIWNQEHALEVEGKNGRWVVPSREFLPLDPFFIVKENFYILIKRFHLTAETACYPVDDQTIKIVVKDLDYLAEDELLKSKYYEFF